MKTIEDISKLGDDELRVMCAEGAGWKPKIAKMYAGVRNVKVWEASIGGYLKTISSPYGLPNYPHSIDAVHAAVNARDEEFQDRFQDELITVANMGKARRVVALTARDWAICFAFCAQQQPAKGGSMSARVCEVCGARVRNMNPRVTTCGHICTEAKHKGRTHKHQMRLEANRTDPRHECSPATPSTTQGHE